MPETRSPSLERDGALVRFLRFSLGTVFVLFSAALIVVFVEGLVFHPVRFAQVPQAKRILWAGAACLLFGGAAMFGARLALRGLRGAPTSTASRWLGSRRLNPLALFFVLWPFEGLLLLLITGFQPLASIRDPGMRVFCCFGLVGLVIPISVAIHELGHSVAGTTVGLATRVLRIGPLVLSRTSGGLRACLDWTPLGGLLGFNEFDWGDRKARRGQLFIALLGGPLSNLYAVLVCLLLLPVGRAPSLGADLLITAMVVNVWFLVVNTVPFRLRSGFATDGLRLLKLLRRPSEAESLVERLSRRRSGARPRAWGVSSEALVAKSRETSGRIRSTLQLLAFSVAQDAGAHAAASEILQDALSDPKLDPMVRYDLQGQNVLRAALLEEDPVRARNLLADFRSDRAPPFYGRLAEAAVLLAEENRAAAAAALQDWIERADRSGLGPHFRSGNEWALERLEAALSEAVA